MKTRPNTLPTITILCLLFTGQVFADWSAEFHPSTNNKHALLIDLPDDLDIATLITLAVELDGIDITSLISLEGRDFSYTPIQALDSGSHILRLMVQNPDGSMNEKAQWTFNIANAKAANLSQQQMANAEAWLRSATFKADTLTEFSNRVAQNNIDNSLAHTTLSGSGNAQATIESEKISIKMHSNYTLQSESKRSVTGKTADIGEYDITVNYAGNSVTTGFTLGHHDVGLNSMLFSSFQRRGASARIEKNNGRVAANIFAFRPDAQAGARDFTGLSNSRNRLEGVSTTLKPFSSDSDALKLTGLYYDGQGSTGGVGVSGQEEIATGSGWGMIFEKNLAKGKVDVRGEYARAHYDADGNANLAPEDSSDAISFLVEARPFSNLVVLGDSMNITVGAKYERIDTFFESLANQGIAADHDAITAYSNLYWGSLSADLQLLHATNNVDDLASSPTDRQRNVTWNTNYSFDTQTGSRAWLGTPYLNFSGFISTLDREDTPSGYDGYDTDNTSTSLIFGGGSSYEQWFWSLSHAYASLDDHTDTMSDTVSHFSSLSAGWNVSNRLTMNGDVQYGIFKDKSNSDTSYSTNMNFGLNSVLIKNKLNLDIQYNLNLPGGSDDSPDKHIVNSSLEWTMRQARTNHPGIALAIRGSMEKTNGNSSNVSDETQYQIFAVLRITAPFSAGD